MTDPLILPEAWVAHKGKADSAVDETVIYCLGKKALGHVLSHPAVKEEKTERWLYSDPEIVRAMIGKTPVTVLGGRVGGPATAKIVEELIACGAKRIIAIGRFCGFDGVGIGDIVLVNSVLTEDGTSRAYYRGDSVPADITLLGMVALSCGEESYELAETVSVDAPYLVSAREKTDWQERGAVGFEMEMGAVYSVAAYRGVGALGVLVASDRIAGDTWEPLFSGEDVDRGLRGAADIVVGAI